MIDMAPSLPLLILVGVLVGAGVILVLERSLSRIIIGVSLITYGVNVLLLMAGGRAGGPPILGQSEVSEMADPLPQALVLTAIVIAFAMTAVTVVLAIRSRGDNDSDHVDGSKAEREFLASEQRRHEEARDAAKADEAEPRA